MTVSPLLDVFKLFNYFTYNRFSYGPLPNCTSVLNMGFHFRYNHVLLLSELTGYSRRNLFLKFQQLKLKLIFSVCLKTVISLKL